MDNFRVVTFWRENAGVNMCCFVCLHVSFCCRAYTALTAFYDKWKEMVVCLLVNKYELLNSFFAILLYSCIRQRHVGKSSWVWRRQRKLLILLGDLVVTPRPFGFIWKINFAVSSMQMYWTFVMFNLFLFYCVYSVSVCVHFSWSYSFIQKFGYEPFKLFNVRRG